MKIFKDYEDEVGFYPLFSSLIKGLILIVIVFGFYALIYVSCMFGFYIGSLIFKLISTP